MFLVVSLVLSSRHLPLIQQMDTAMVTEAVLKDLGSTFRCKHLFVLMYLHPDWIHDRSSIGSNELSQISLDYGPWHGAASYESDNFWGGRWHLQFATPNSDGRMTHHLFVQVRGGMVFLNLEYSRPQQRYTSMLLPSPDDQIPAWEIERARNHRWRREQQVHDAQV